MSDGLQWQRAEPRNYLLETNEIDEELHGLVESPIRNWNGSDYRCRTRSAWSKAPLDALPVAATNFYCRQHIERSYIVQSACQQVPKFLTGLASFVRNSMRGLHHNHSATTPEYRRPRKYASTIYTYSYTKDLWPRLICQFLHPGDFRRPENFYLYVLSKQTHHSVKRANFLEFFFPSIQQKSRTMMKTTYLFEMIKKK